MKRKILTVLLALSCVFPLSALGAEEARAMMPPAPWIRPYMINGRNQMEAELVSGMYGSRDFTKTFPKNVYTMVRIAPASEGNLVVRMTFRNGRGRPAGDTSFLAHKTGQFTYEGEADGFVTKLEFKKNTLLFTRRQSTRGGPAARTGNTETVYRLTPEEFPPLRIPRMYVPMAEEKK